MTEPPTTLKLLVIGASSVGKSSLLLRFTDETFLSPDETSATIGVDFKVKVIERRNKRWKLSIWDTAGQERFRTLTSSYYRGAQGVILVYDITARDTFDSLASWINELDTFAGTGPASREVVRMIVGNKVDKEFSRTVSTEEGRAFAASRDPPWLFMECSAKKGGDDVSGAEGIFGKVVDKIIDTPSLYTRTSMPGGSAAAGASGGRKQAGGPPGQYPGGGKGTVNLDEEMQGSSWCAC
ncbi:ras family-domain-containing protein [Rhodotorula diobovata]|uniref:Ras family-domain-containing protein n=1 Tax=Rhodotorula diobovata TaxID=5288 RepID=A0A5C5FY51_9BASI|nr:ras family-domain-containing protein [Rhodotorula diobovata]